MTAHSASQERARPLSGHLHPEVAAYLEQQAALGLPTIDSLPLAQTRAGFARVLAQCGGPRQPVARIEDLTLPGPRVGGAAGPDLAARLYHPQPDRQLGVLVYFHGGGWVIGDLDTHDALCRDLAVHGECAVLAVDYRLAPEHPFPAAVDDARAALHWCAAHGGALHLDPTRVAVGGDSAGGNLAAVLALDSRDGGLALAFQLLIYPAIDLGSLDTESYRQCASGFGLTRADVAWFLEQYFGADDASRHDWRASPLRAPDLRDLPPALVMTAEFDVLRSEGEDYAVALEAAGNAVTLRRYDGATHGFMSMAGLFELGRQGRRDAAAALKAALG